LEYLYKNRADEEDESGSEEENILGKRSHSQVDKKNLKQNQEKVKKRLKLNIDFEEDENEAEAEEKLKEVEKN
jgi:hypothetical protein